MWLEANRALLESAIRCFNSGDFYESHELLEQLWRQAGPSERLLLQGLIHFAAGFHHYRRNNRAGACGQWRKGLARMRGCPEVWEGLHVGAIAAAVAACLASVEAGDSLKNFPQLEQAAEGGTRL